jgi:hypothetical protein
MTAGQLLEVRRADTELECRACPEPIRVGQGAALILGRGRVHIKCLLILATDASERRNADDK